MSAQSERAVSPGHRISDIEVLRAIAVLFVVFQHLPNLFPWELPSLSHLQAYIGGTFGVDLFFAVSGFVIARDLVPRMLDAADGHAARRIMLSFWLRRMWRLWPAAWLWLGLILLASVAFNTSGAFGSVSANLWGAVAGVFQFANVRFAENFMVRESGASFVYWSLSLEEQFYLLFPLLILLFKRQLGWFMLSVAVVQLCLSRTPYLMVFRTDALALGVLIALWSNRQSWHRWSRPFAALQMPGRLLLLVIAVGAMAVISGNNFFNGYAFLVITPVSALVVWMAAYDADFVMRAGPLKRVLMWVGSRSYAIYLIHIPAYFAIRELFFRLGLAASPSFPLLLAYLVCGISLLLLLAELNYRFVEVPLRRYGVAFSARLIAAPAQRIGEQAAPVETVSRA